LIHTALFDLHDTGMIYTSKYENYGRDIMSTVGFVVCVIGE